MSAVKDLPNSAGDQRTLYAAGDSHDIKPRTEDGFSSFCFMVLEEFMMKKGLTKTLDAFRSEYSIKDQVIIYYSQNIIICGKYFSQQASATMNWYDLILKLHMSDLPPNCSHGDPVLENIVKYLISESSVRMRKPQEVIVRGLASVPKSFSTMPNIEKSKELMLKTLSPLKSGDDMPMHYPPLNSLKNLRPLKSELTQDVVFQPPAKYDPEKYKAMKSEMDKPGKSRASSENWVPELTRMRSLHRLIAVAKENVHDVKVREMSTARELKQFKKSAFDRARELEDLKVDHRHPCACCYQTFLPVNLPLKVSNKAVVDMRKKWSGDSKIGWWVKIDKKLSDISRAYDDVSVCVFCSQFFHDQDSYRPSMETLYKEKRKKAYFEQRRLEMEYWDPLKMSEKARAESEMNAALSSFEGDQSTVLDQESQQFDEIESYQ
jgi:hypothetical protein